MDAQRKHEAEQDAKLAADQYAQKQTQYADYSAQASAAPAGQAHGTDCADSTESLRTRMHRRLNDATGETQKYSRIVRILDRHPEFAEFLELVRLIPQHELYR